MKTPYAYNSSRFIPTISLLALLCLAYGLMASLGHAATTKGDYHLILNGRSIHLQAPPEGASFNENNFGTGVQYEFERQLGSKWVSYITSSAFTDSFNHLSYYAGGGQTRRYQLQQGWHLDVGYVAFMMARKDINDYKPFPGVLPVLSIGTRKVAINVTYIPDVNEQVDELIFFQLKVATQGW